MKVYFSVDIETNGLAAGINSMISLGCAAIDMDSGKIVGTFKVNINPIPDLKVDVGTMQWWANFPDAYAAATRLPQQPLVAMAMFEEFVKSFNVERPVMAAWKPGFDGAFIRYYLHRFLGRDLFGRAGSGLDIKTLTAAALNTPFSEVQIATVPAELKAPGVDFHSHDALEDAMEQAYVLYNAAKKLGVNI